MKRILLSMALMAASAVASLGQQVRGVEMEHLGEHLFVKMDIHLSEALPGSNETVVLTPELRSGAMRQALQPVCIYSRNQWYYYERSGRKAGDSSEYSLRQGQAPEVLHYETKVPYQDWMSDMGLFLVRETKSCCGREKASPKERFLSQFEEEVPVAEPSVRIDTVYVERTVVVEKSKESRTRSIDGRAYIDFPVGETSIQPRYHSNAKELEGMRSTIENALRNPAWSIKKVWIKGYASPEGPSEKNDALAKSRTESIRDYVVSVCRLDGSLVEMEYEAENWSGLREFVDRSSLPHRVEILEIIDGDRLPDDKEWMIKSRYAGDWRTIVNDCLPYLRRTDYRIDYEIKEEINN